MDRPEVAILTSEEHKPLAELCARGIRRFWPEVAPRIYLDTDHTTETPLPPDLRELVRRVPYLRRPLDLPWRGDSETIYVLDADCFVFRPPTDFSLAAFQGVPNYMDDLAGIGIWKSLGLGPRPATPLFCGGMYSCPRRLFLDNREMMIAYLRKCIEAGYDRDEHPGVICEQGLVAGIWRANLPDNPLDPMRYPIHRMTGQQIIFHAGAGKHAPNFGKFLEQYEKFVA